MKKLSLILLMLIIPFVFMGCKELNLTMDDSGKTVEVSKGTTIKIELVSNRSTGNSWRKVDFDNSIIEQAAEPVYEKNQNGLVGAPGKVVFVFKAKAAGKTTLNMEYGSPADMSKAPVKSFKINIVVK